MIGRNHPHNPILRNGANNQYWIIDLALDETEIGGTIVEQCGDRFGVAER